MGFGHLGLSTQLLANLETQGHSEPTQIQTEAIPPIFKGKDIIGCAQTGTGKTGAFALPIIQMISGTPLENRTDTIKGLVLAPTRELALQIKASFDTYGQGMGIRSTTLYGGASKRAQINSLEDGVDVVIATPGRILDIIGMGKIDLRGVEYLVLDEADRMLDMGFRESILKVIAEVQNRAKQVMCFSATINDEVQKLVNGILSNPVRIDVTPPNSTTELISQEICFSSNYEKLPLLASLLENPDYQSVLVFTNTKRETESLQEDLRRLGIVSEVLHGDKEQWQREATLKSFKDKKVRVLIATDVASRGLDIPRIDLVVNYDLPNNLDAYVHRIGRTGRAGIVGHAITLCNYKSKFLIPRLEKLIGKPIPVRESTGRSSNGGGYVARTVSARSPAQEWPAEAPRVPREPRPDPRARKLARLQEFGGAIAAATTGKRIYMPGEEQPDIKD